MDVPHGPHPQFLLVLAFVDGQDHVPDVVDHHVVVVVVGGVGLEDVDDVLDDCHFFFELLVPDLLVEFEGVVEDVEDDDGADDGGEDAEEGPDGVVEVALPGDGRVAGDEGGDFFRFTVDYLVLVTRK